MSVAELTPEQRSAIHTRDVSIALSAGAGCGKTFVLTQRFISHLDPLVDTAAGETRLSQLIAITFTDAAAREMRDRIRKACYNQLAVAKTEAEESHWQRLLREIDSARVSTIHAFCAALLRNHAAAAGLDPLFRVLDQSDAQVLQLEVIDDELRQQLSDLNPKCLELAATYGLARLKQQISALIGYRHDEHFAQWLEIDAEEMVSRWRRWYEQEAPALAVREIAAVAPVDVLLDLLRNVVPDAKKAPFIDARANLLELLPRLARQEVSLKDVAEIRESAKVKGVCTAKDWNSPEDYDTYKNACESLRKTIDKHLPKPFDPDAARQTAQLGLDLLHLTNDVARRYEERKREQGKLDFDDLLYETHRFLTDPRNDKLRQELANELRLLLVDEFQDTDHLQARLVKVLCGKGFEVGRLFFVGDFKQSIYRFRGAEPGVFRELRAEIHVRGRLPLTLNFRSQPGVIDFVNALFSQSLQIGDEPYEALRAHRKQATDGPSVEFLWTITPDKKNRGIAGASLEARRLEAQAIARRLRALLDGVGEAMPVVDKGTGKARRAGLGDIAILFRTLNDVQVYEEALREYDLDYYLVGGHAFYAQQEIYDILNLFRAVSSTADEVSLAGVLRSPFFSLVDETLFWLVESAGSLNAGLFAGKLPKQLSTEELAKTQAAADTIRHLREQKDRVPIATLLGFALERTGYDAILLAEFLGQRKLANLHKLMERARAADQGGVIDLDGFITQLAQFIAHQPKEALAATLPEAADVIRLMTIHHAKGLEFPLVVLPDLDRPPRFGVPQAAFHPEFGPLVPTPTDEDHLQGVSTGMSLFAALEKAEELEERKRLLYVACTRAADYLILSSSLEDYSKPRSDWMKLIGERFDLESGESLFDGEIGVGSQLVRAETEGETDYKPSGRTRMPDLLKVIGEARELAVGGEGFVARESEPVAVDYASRKQFSFSRLTGRIIRHEEAAVVSDGDALPEVSIGVEEVEHPSAAIDSMTLGTLVHEVLASVDFRDPQSVGPLCEQLASQLVLLNTDAACKVARELVERFVASPRGRAIAEAADLRREVEFMLAWPPMDGDKAKRDEAWLREPIYLRGYIDCLHRDRDGRWLITDYKTNDVRESAVRGKAEQYAMQLYVYAMAVEKSLGESPSELAVYFLRPGVEHVFEWNAATRKKAVGMVNEALAAARGAAGTVGDGRLAFDLLQ